MSDSGSPARTHVPVMAAEVVRLLSPVPRGLYLDGTVGEGGHAEAVLAASSPEGRLLGVDRDRQALAKAADSLARFNGRFELVHGNFGDLAALMSGKGGFDGILLDLGVNSSQLDDPCRGFSFRAEGDLDMRMDRDSRGATAADLVNGLPEAELRRIFFEYGQERHAGRIARRIVEAREKKPLRKTLELADLISRTVSRRGRLHPATRVFQALRIEVNGEIGNLGQALAALPGLLRTGGVAVVISFHSLEDRQVKYSFREGARAGAYELLTRKPVVPSAEERAANPRSRSAKLRAVRKAGRRQGWGGG